MKLSDVLSKVMVEAERVGFDALDALGHAVAVYDTEGNRLGDVDEIAVVHGEVQISIVPLKPMVNGATSADPNATGTVAP